MNIQPVLSRNHSERGPRHRDAPVRTRVVLMLAILALLAGACGGGDDDEGGSGEPGPSTNNTEEPGQADPEGVVRLAADLQYSAGGGFQFDPSAATSSGGAQTGFQHWVFGGLMRPNGEGEVVPDLAESAEVVDPNTIEVKMRTGLTLSDGRSLDAELVKTILEANLEKVNPSTGQPPLQAFRPGFYSLESVTLTDANTLTLSIPDGTAASWYDLFLPGHETIPVPPGTDFDRPVGAGPLTVEEWVPGQRLVVAKNPRYWDAESIEFASIELIHVPPDNPQPAVSAVNSGQADWSRIDFSQRDAVTKDVVADADPQFITELLMCKNGEPLDDVRIRQALNYATDREQINDAIFDGAGTLAWDLWPEDHPLHNDELTGYYEFDPEKAMDLLSDAGAVDLDIELVVFQGAFVPEIAQVLQQQWDAVGVNLSLRPTTNIVEDLNRATAPLVSIPRSGAGRGKLNNFSGPSTSNFCQYNDPALEGLITQLAAVTDSSEEGQQLWHEIQQIMVEDALLLPLVFQPRLYALDSDRLGAYSLAEYPTVPLPDVWELFVKR